MEQQSIENDPLEPTPSQTQFGMIRMAWRRKPLVALGLAVSLAIGLIYYARCSPVYQATAQVLVIKKRPDALPLAGADPRLSLFEDYLATHVALIKSPMIVDRAVQRDGLQGYSPISDEGGATGSIIKWITVVRDRDTGGTNNNILNLAFRSTRPEECSKVLNGVIKSYKDFLDETYRNVSDETMTLITQARDVALKELEKKEEQYLEFRKKGSPLWRSKDGSTLYQVRLNDIEGKRTMLQVRRTEIEGRLKTLEAVLKKGRRSAGMMAMIMDWSTKLEGDRLGARLGKPTRELEEQMLPLLLEEESLKESFGPDFPQLKNVRKRIEIARAMVSRSQVLGKGGDTTEKEEEEREKELVGQYIESLKQELEDTITAEETFAELFERESQEARKLASYELEDIKLNNEIGRIKQLYDGIIKRLQEVGFAKDFGGYDAQIIAPAGKGKKVEPRASLVFSLAALLGILGGLGLAYVAEVTDKSFRTPEEIRRRLSLPVIGHIPLFTADLETPEHAGSQAPALDPTLCTYYQSRSVEAEAYRMVRTALYFSTRGEWHKVVQITSPNPGDGKTTLAANLAISMAQSGKKVLLVDADFRKPSVHKKFGISTKTGLSLVLSREVPLAEAIQESGIAGLWVLPCGPLPPNPAELLTSPQFKDNLDHLREQYDFVLVDTPPLLAVTDPSVVAPRVDGILLTIRVSKNGRPQAERAKEILGTLGANILGVVVNGLDRRGTTVGYEQYSYGGAYGLQEANAEYITGIKSPDEPEESAESILEPQNLANGSNGNPMLSGNSKINGRVKERPRSRKAGLIRRFFKF